MAQIELTDHEAETLKEILRSYLSELRAEIADTDRMKMRDALKEKEVFINRVLKDLGA
ncbi:MAG: hypothetical protein L0Y39_06995 [Methylococcaceae bacterium]|nr:hypothetical protein [Methylococcaceae bacterium]